MDDKYVSYPGFVSEAEKYRYLRGARGFALLSQFESGCIAVYEAAAAGLPLFLSNLPWADQSYPLAKHLHLAELRSAKKSPPIWGNFTNRRTGEAEPPSRCLSWRDVAKEYLRLYEKILTH